MVETVPQRSICDSSGLCWDVFREHGREEGRPPPTPASWAGLCHRAERTRGPQRY